MTNFTHADARTLNIECACQAAIDLAMHLIASQRLGMPKSSADAFRLVQNAGLISEPLGKRLRAMTGFRNVAIHEYREIDKAILHHIAKKDGKTLSNSVKPSDFVSNHDAPTEIKTNSPRNGPRTTDYRQARSWTSTANSLQFCPRVSVCVCG